MKIETIIPIELQDSVKKIISSYSELERQDRLMRVMKALKNRSLLRGDRPDWFDLVQMQWFPFEKSPKYNAQDAPTYKFNPNIFQAVWQILQAAFATTGIPGSEIVPQNRKQAQDVAVAKVGDSIREYGRTAINFRSLWLKNFRYQFTDGISLFHIRHVRNSDRYGFRDVEKVVQKNKTFRPAGYECAFCGWFGKENDSATEQALEKGTCPDCGLPVLQEDHQDAIKGMVPTKNIEQVAVGKELVDAYGLVESRLPFWAPSLERAPYAAIETLADKNGILAAFGELDELEEKLSYTKTDDTTEATNDFARRMSLSPAGIPISEVGRLITYRRWWLDPEAFYGEKDTGKRRELLAAYDDGALFQIAGSQIVDAHEEKKANHLVVCRAFESDGMYPDALGDNGVPIQQSVTIAYNMKMEAGEFASFPPVLYDKGTLSKAIFKIRIRAAMFLGIEVPGGKTLKDSYHQMMVKESSQVLESLLNEAWHWMELLMGAEAALRGGALTNNRTKGGYELAKNQALQRLSPVYQSSAIAFSEIEERLVHECVANRSRDELAEIVGQTMDEIPPELLAQDLDIAKGRIYARAEDSEAIPATWAQQVSAAEALLNSNNPLTQKWLADPNNAEFLFRVMGLKGFIIAGKATQRRMEKLIPQMLRGQSVQFDEIMNDAGADLRLIQEWASTDEGMNAQAKNPQGFAVVKSYAQQAAHWLAQISAPPAPPEKPGESINFKDLPPDGKVQMAQQAGIKIAPPPPEPAPGTNGAQRPQQVSIPPTGV